MTGIIEGLVFALLASNAVTFGLAGSALFISALSAGIMTALSIGLQLAFRQKPATPQPSDVQANIRQEISARRRIYSRYLTGSVVVFGFRRGEKIYVLHYICEGPIQGYVSFRVDRKPVTLNENGFVTDEQYQYGGRSRVQILVTLGLMDDGPFQAILDAFPELDDPLKPFRHRGCAMVLQIIEQVPFEEIQEVYPNNLPSLQVVVDGLNDIYDPRTGTSGLSGNAGLCLLAESMDVYGLTSADADEIAFDAWATFADHCDEDVALKAGGTEKRYRCAGLITLDAENEARIAALAATCNADVFIDPQGRLSVRERLTSTASIALREKNGDHLSVQIEGGRGDQQKFNRVNVTYVDPALNWKANVVSWRHHGMITEDGEELPRPLDVLLCPSPTQAQRLGKLHLHEANPEFAGSLIAGPQALELIATPVFTMDLAPENDLTRTAVAGPVEFDAAAASVSTTFTIPHEDATGWEPSVDEQEEIVVPPELPSYVDDILLDVTVTVELLANSAPVLKFSWEAAGSADLPDSYAAQVEVSPADEDDWSPAAVNQVARTAQFAPVADGGAYDWRIRNVASGKTFDWQESDIPVTVVVDSTPPPALVSFSATGAPGAVLISCQTANSAHQQQVKVYIVPAGVALDKSVHPYVAVMVGPNQIVTNGGIGTAGTDVVTNGSFASDTGWSKGTGWTIGSGVASRTAQGGASTLSQSIGVLSAGVWRLSFDVTTYNAGLVRGRLLGGTTVNGTNRTALGSYAERITAVSGNNALDFIADAAGAFSIDNVALVAELAGMLDPGRYDLHAFPANVSGVEGPAAPVASNIRIT